MNIISQSQFDPNNLHMNVSPHFNVGNEAAQYFTLFTYQFDNKTDQALILTDPIEVRGGGIPLVDKSRRTTDNKCLEFYLNLDTDNCMLLKTQLIDPLDNKFKHLCGNETSIVDVGIEKVLKRCKYLKCNKSVDYHYDDDDNNDDDDDNYKSKHLNRIKLQIDTVYDPNANKDAQKKIKTAVFLPMNKFAPIDEREFNDEPEPINCLDDLRNLFHTGCTVRLVIKINKFWVNKTINGQHKSRQCGITLKCMQIYVLDDPTWYTFNQLKHCVEGSVITQSQFDPKNLHMKIVPHLNVDNNVTQYFNLFDYQFNNKKDQALILTDPIKVRGRGIPFVNAFRMTDNECLHFYLHLDMPDGQLLKHQLFDPIDNKFQHLLCDNNKSVDVGNGKVLKCCRYRNCVNLWNYNWFNDNDDDNDDDMDDNDKDKSVYRVKFKIDTVYNKKANQNAQKKIKTTVFLPMNKFAPINQRKFNDKPEPINCLDDLRNLFRPECTVRLVIKINRFWANNMIDSELKLRRCGITFKCMQIYIIDDPNWYTHTENIPVVIKSAKKLETNENSDEE